MIEPAEFFLNIRPPLTKSEMERIIADSQGRLSLKTLRDPSANLGVTVYPRPDGTVERFTFLPSMPRHLSLEGLQIGISEAELLARFPALSSVNIESLVKLGIRQFEGATTQSGHEVAVRVRDGRVVAFDIARAGLRAEEARKKQTVGAKLQARRREQEIRLQAMRNMSSTRADDDAMLFRWAEEVDSSQRLARFMTATATPDDWHAIATTWNCDNGLEPLFWIVRRPECDMATALQAFWLAEPTYFVRYAGDPSSIPDHAAGTFYFVTEVFMRWTRGFYLRSEISYDPAVRLPATALDRDGNIRDIPSSMGAILNGRTISIEQYAEGIPSFLWRPGELVG